MMPHNDEWDFQGIILQSATGRLSIEEYVFSLNRDLLWNWVWTQLMAFRH